MNFTFNGKPILPTKTAMDEMSDIGLNLYEVPEILEKGFEIRKRGKDIIEKGVQRGNKIVNVVVVDRGTHFTLIHVGRFTASKKFKRKRGDNYGIRES